MKSVLRKTGVQNNGTLFRRRVQQLAYTDDMNIIGCTKQAVCPAFNVIERESAVIRKIFGPTHVGDSVRIRTNKELYNLFNDMDVVHHINM